MLISQVKSLAPSELENWVEEKTKNSFDDNPFCYVITFDKDYLQEWLDDPFSNQLGKKIQKLWPELPNERIDKIDEGAALTKKEKDFAKEAIFVYLSEDEFNGVNYMSRQINCEDGELTAVYHGINNVGGAGWMFHGVFSSQSEFIEILKEKLTDDERLFRI